MNDLRRGRVRMARVAAILFAVWALVLASTPSAFAASSWDGHPAHRAVWKIVDAKRGYQASTFAVGPRLVVTVAHTLFNAAWKAGTDKLMLVQAGRDGPIEIVRARAISATHDLALLETATAMEHHLKVARSLPHGLADQFHAAGYPKAEFGILSVITDVLYGDADYYRLPMDRVVLGGISGAPVLAPNGEVIAVQRRSDDNIAEATRFQVLQEILDGETGARCGSMALKACLEAAAEHTKQRAEGGDIAAQYQLGREHRYIPGAPELRWLRRAAEQGHSGARTELGIALYFGERGLPRDWVKSNHWLRLAAEEEDPVAQLNLSVSYFYGEGVQADQAEGLEWQNRALRNGYVGAEYNLGISYFKGDGLTVDKDLGRYWLRRAAARGDEGARDYLKESVD